jgi:hypothetical protein
MSNKLEKDFLELHKGRKTTRKITNSEGLEHIEFWREEYIESVYKAIESRYRTDVIRNFCITEIKIKDKKVLTKWARRFKPLTKEELSENYER